MSTSHDPEDELKLKPKSSSKLTKPAYIVLRTYALALSFSLGPALVPFVTNALRALYSYSRGRRKTLTLAVDLDRLQRVLRRHLGYDGFAFAMTLAIGGGALLSRLCTHWTMLNPVQSTFLSNLASSWTSMLLLQAGNRRIAQLRSRNSTLQTKTMKKAPSPTLDLTFLLLVRALDSLLQGFIIRRVKHSIEGPPDGLPITSTDKGNDEVRDAVHKKLEAVQAKKEKSLRRQWTDKVDAFVFWASSARIMWCFCYEPFRLPQAYVHWITTLASLDTRLITTLQSIRSGQWSYIHGASTPSHASLLRDTASNLGYPATWGDPSVLPAFAGNHTSSVWKTLGVKGREGVGGLPCEIVHATSPFVRGIGHGSWILRSCTANALLRMLKAFIDALAIYIPVHFLPVLLTRPKSLLSMLLLSSPSELARRLLASLRSSLFLSSFIFLFWSSVCFVRTTLPSVFLRVSRLLRSLSFQNSKLSKLNISHDTWDGPYGAILAGCLVCGASIWVEEGRRRGEMAMYVLPRALGSFLPFERARGQIARQLERITFALSLALLLTNGTYRPESLRGLSRWMVGLVLGGPGSQIGPKGDEGSVKPSSNPASW